MAVFRELTLTVDGKQYTFVPTMMLMRSIEEDYSFTRLVRRIQDNDTPISILNYVLVKVLRAAGSRMSEEEVYKHLSSMSGDAQAEIMRVIMTAFIPQEEEGKNLDAQTENQSKARAKKERMED